MSVQIDMPVTLIWYSYMAIKKLKRSQGRQYFFEGGVEVKNIGFQRGGMWWISMNLRGS